MKSLLASALLLGASVTSLFGVTASSLSSFGGIEEPLRIYRPSSNSFTNDSYVNITDQGSGRIRTYLRFRANDWWDADRDTDSTDRQRAEVKVLGPRQRSGETFEYGSTWRTSTNMVAGSRFCHITQVKGYGGGDIGSPLVTTTLRQSNVVNVEYHSSGGGDGTARSWSWSPGAWTRSVVRLKIGSGGLLQVSVNGDSFTGVTNRTMDRSGAPEYQPKWGLYRGCDNNQPFGDNYLEHENVTAIQGTSNPGGSVAAPSFSPGSGTYTSPVSVTLSTSTSGATIRYTTNGTTPSSSSGTVYSGPITISSTTTVRAIAYTSTASSSVSSATYTFGTTGGTPIGFEAESLSRITSGVSATTDSDSLASGGARVTLNATNTGSWVEFTTPSIPAGTYRVDMSAKFHNNRGIHVLRVDGTQVGSSVDQYVSSPTYPTRTYGTVTFTTSGTHKIRLTVTGKNSASSSYTISADRFTLTPQ